MTEVQPSVSQSMLLQVMEQLSAVDGKIGVLQGQNNLILADQRSAAEGRKQIYEKLTKVDTLEVKLDRIVPLVDRHEVAHQQTAGVMSVGKWLIGLSAGAIGAAIAMVAQWLSGGGPRHP